MPEQRIHLISNAHLDPVWLWEWEEGAAEAISTFRAAADFCEEFDGFIFNHNEVILYRWVEEYEPELFTRIQRLVAEGRWHIMGGWFLQPDCNMPSGESFVRQALAGRRYFAEHFGVRPTTALNLDPFGHTRGLVQILVKSGYDSYLFCRPNQNDCPLPADNFVWVGYDGSEVIAHRARAHYNSRLGRATEKIRKHLDAHPDENIGMVMWGVGNHGGGPSRLDLRRIAKMNDKLRGNASLIHSTPEKYFEDLRENGGKLPRHAGDLNSWAPGCYTSQVRLKQLHRKLENELYATEKMAATLWLQGRMEYPVGEFTEASRDLLHAEFHDILPGSSIQPVEETSMRLMHHGLDLLSRVKARAFFSLAQGQPKAATDRIPILVYNPHPFPVRAIIQCELQPSDPVWEEQYTEMHVHAGARALPTQCEKEASNVPLDWRKRVVFAADLAPGRMNRFDCKLQVLPRKPPVKLKARNGRVYFKTADLEVAINEKTGLMDRWRVGGRDLIKPGAFAPVILEDNEDPWETQKLRFDGAVTRFKLMGAREGTKFSGVRKGLLPSVRVIEDGAVRTIVEVLLQGGDSRICQRYHLPKSGTEIEIETRVHWNEKSRMLKLEVPVALADPSACGQVAYGRETFVMDGRELVAQKWVAVGSEKDELAITCVNEGTYGLDFRNQRLRISLLRAPAYSAHPIANREIVPQDRYTPRIDQGERLFRFWLNGGPLKERLDAIDREALARNERPMALSFFPAGSGSKPAPAALLSDGVVQLTALKRAEGEDALIARLFEPTGRRRTTTLSLPTLGLKIKVTLTPFEIKTLKIDLRGGGWREVNLMEEAGES